MATKILYPPSTMSNTLNNLKIYSIDDFYEIKNKIKEQKLITNNAMKQFLNEK